MSRRHLVIRAVAIVALCLTANQASLAQTFTPTSTESALAVINIAQHVVFSGDVTSQVNAILSANASTYNYKIIFGPGIYQISGNGLIFPTPAGANFPATMSSTGVLSWDVEFRPGATLQYSGSVAAVNFVDTKRVHISNLTIDMLNNANSSATGLSLAGIWEGRFDSPTVVLGAAGQTGIAITSSDPSIPGTPKPNFGTYDLTFAATRIQGARGGIGVSVGQASQDASASVGVTHVLFDGGWIEGTTQPFQLVQLHKAVFQNVAMDNIVGTQAFSFDQCSDILVVPGELPLAGTLAYDFNLAPTTNGNTNSAITLLTTGLSGDYTANPSSPTGLALLARDRATFYGGRDSSSAGYNATFESRFSYALPFAINVQGSGSAQEQVIGWAPSTLDTTTKPAQP